MNVNIKTKNWLMAVIGAAIGVLGIAIFIAIVIPADPSSLRQQALAKKVAAAKASRVQPASATGVVDMTAGKVVAEIIGVSTALGLVAWGFNRRAARRVERERATLRSELAASNASEIPIATLQVVEASASEFDESPRPDSAPVLSLTDAQVKQRRAALSRQTRLAATAGADRG